MWFFEFVNCVGETADSKFVGFFYYCVFLYYKIIYIVVDMIIAMYI